VILTKVTKNIFQHIALIVRIPKGTWYSQKNGAISKVTTKFISQPTRTQLTLSAAETAQVSNALQQFASHAYCGAAGPASKMSSQQEKAFCVLRFEVSRSVITVQRQFRARFKKDIILAWCVFFKPCRILTLHCYHRSGHLKTEYKEGLLLLRRHLGNWQRGPAASMRSELLAA
jgi:hypothetical protein